MGFRSQNAVFFKENLTTKWLSQTLWKEIGTIRQTEKQITVPSHSLCKDLEDFLLLILVTK